MSVTNWGDVVRLSMAAYETERWKAAKRERKAARREARRNRERPPLIRELIVADEFCILENLDAHMEAEGVEKITRAFTDEDHEHDVP